MTIEERADHYIVKQTCEDYNDRRIGYIDGATEQKKIDDEVLGKALLYCTIKTTERVNREMIDKACDTFCRINCPTLCKYGEPCECGGRIHQDCDEYKQFRKTMEEL